MLVFALMPINSVFADDKTMTREEGAVAVVKALGYEKLAEIYNSFESDFTDVNSNKGYITIADDLELIKAKSQNTFSPQELITKSEVDNIIKAAQLKREEKIKWLHGFYAFSSFSQKEIGAKMDSISYGWSRMDFNPNEGVILNTKGSNNNEWKIPQGYEEAVKYYENNNVSTNLNIYMSTAQTIKLDDNTSTNACKEIITNSENRKKAISLIINELTRAYPEFGKNIYSGVTIDFENMKGKELKEGFNLFLGELKTELNKIHKNLYVAVQPKLKNGSEYFDSYDFKTIGEIADKVILMAHDYNANKISTEVMASGFTTTPLTPFDEVYYALRIITDEITGVKDKSKIALALSINNVGWVKNIEGKIKNSSGNTHTLSELYEIINNRETVYSYSDKYRNPYVNYINKSTGEAETIWYENTESINDKIELASLFGVKGISIWRIGNIPDYEDSGLNVWSRILTKR